MVNNPIYSGPVYESIQPKLDTLTATQQHQVSSVATQPSSNRPACSPNAEGTVRYVDQPVHASPLQSKSFVSIHSSAPSSGNAANILQSESVSTQATKKNQKQRNKFHLTLSLGGNDPDCGTDVTSGSSLPAKSEGQASPMACINPVVHVLSDAGMLNAGYDEISPEDTEKYTEFSSFQP